MGDSVYEAQGAAPNQGLEAKQCSSIGPVAYNLNYYIATGSSNWRTAFGLSSLTLSAGQFRRWLSTILKMRVETLFKIILVPFLVPSAFAIPTPANDANNTLTAPAIPADFKVEYDEGPGDPLEPYHVVDAFLTGMRAYAEKPYGATTPNDKIFDQGTRTVRLAISATRFHDLLVNEAMWALSLCAGEVARGGPGGERPWAPSGCKVIRGDQKIGYIRIYYKAVGADDSAETVQISAEVNGLPRPGVQPDQTLTARADDNPTLGITTVTRPIAGAADLGLITYASSVFESMITLAALSYPRTENPLISFEYASQSQGTIIKLMSEDVSIYGMPSFYSVVVRGLDALVRKVQDEGGRYNEMSFDFKFTGRKIYGGSIRKI